MSCPIRITKLADKKYVVECRNCGLCINSKSKHFAYSCTGLGYHIQRLLRKLHITEEFVGKVLHRPCRCQARMERLNHISEEIVSWVMRKIKRSGTSTDSN